MIWFILGFKYYSNHLTINPFKSNDFNWLIIGALIITIYFIIAMYCGHGRGRFGERVVKFYKRKSIIK